MNHERILIKFRLKRAYSVLKELGLDRIESDFRNLSRTYENVLSSERMLKHFNLDADVLIPTYEYRNHSHNDIMLLYSRERMVKILCQRILSLVKTLGSYSIYQDVHLFFSTDNDYLRNTYLLPPDGYGLLTFDELEGKM